MEQSDLPAKSSGKTPNLKELQNNGHISERVAGYLEDDWSFYKEWFSHRELARTLREKEIEAAENVMDFKVTLLEMYANYRIEAVEEMLEGELRSSKIQYLGELDQSIIQKRNEVQKAITEKITAFGDMVTRLYDKAEEYDRGNRQKLLKDTVAKWERNYYELVTGLLEEFEESVEREIKPTS